jgi:carbon monoxide dehydrogenase subunit G
LNAARHGAVLLVLACAVPLIWADGAKISLTEQPHQTYTVEGAFHVDASSAVVWGVLTDYDHLALFVASMRDSRLVETRPDGTVIVEQEAVGGVLFFSKTVHVRLEVRRSDEKLSFEDLSHQDFRRYAGSWQTRSVANGTEVTYRLSAEPGFKAPSLLVRRGLKRGARKLLDQVRTEIVRRSAPRRPLKT